MDHDAALDRPSFHLSRWLRPSALNIIILAALGVAASGMAVTWLGHEGTVTDASRMGGDISWRFASFVFAAAVLVGPIGRLLPFEAVQRVLPDRRCVIWGFTASFGIYLAAQGARNLLRGESAATGINEFLILGALVAAAIAFTASRSATPLLGDRLRRNILSAGLCFFWASYAVMGLAHLSGPHRPDGYYGLCLSVMVAVLLVRFSDRLMLRLKSGSAPDHPAAFA